LCYLFNVALRASKSRKTPDVSTPLTNVVALLSCRVVTPVNSSTSPKTEFTRISDEQSSGSCFVKFLSASRKTQSFAMFPTRCGGR
jgi:hypothetical protein